MSTLPVYRGINQRTQAYLADYLQLLSTQKTVAQIQHSLRFICAGTGQRFCPAPTQIFCAALDSRSSSSVNCEGAPANLPGVSARKLNDPAGGENHLN